MSLQDNVRLWRRPLVTALVVATPIVGAWIVLDRHERRELSSAEISSSRASLDALSANSRDMHLENISYNGVTVMRKVLDAKQVRKWRDITRQSFPSAVDMNGRFHFHVATSSPHHEGLARLGGEVWHKGRRVKQTEALAELEPNSLPRIVEAYFEQKKVMCYSLTQLQLLNVVPGSSHQIWHRDNTEPGLTALIVLGDVSTNGPTEMLLQSHKASLWQCLRTELGLHDDSDGFSIGCQPLMACLKEGDVVLYDSRLLHRGRGYSLVQMDRPVLVLRWDSTLTPPPGSGLIITTMTRFVGSWLSTLVYWRSNAYRGLFGWD